MGERLVVVRTLRQSREIGGLGQGQFVDRLVEIIERRGRDPVIAQPEIDLVQVELQDLLLGVGRLDPEGEQRLLDLAVVGALVRQQEVLGYLLRDGGSALQMLALELREGGTGDTLEVDAVVGVEVLVLGRDERMFHQRRNGGGGQVEPALVGVFGEQAAVDRVDAGHHGWLVVLELRVVRQVLLISPDQQADRGRADNKQQRTGREHETQKTGDQPHENQALWWTVDAKTGLACEKPVMPSRWEAVGDKLRLFCGVNAADENSGPLHCSHGRGCRTLLPARHSPRRRNAA